MSMLTIYEQKKEIRRSIRQMKHLLTAEEKQIQSENIFRFIESTDEFINAVNVMIYCSLEDEVPTMSFIHRWRESKVILLPVVDGDDLKIKQFAIGDLLTEQAWSIQEPVYSSDFVGEIDLVIVPGVAFDRMKNRLGRGKGFYDRFLKTTKALKWGICFDFQLIDQIPADDNDVKMDKIICFGKTIN